MFLSVPLVLANQKETRQRLIILHVWNIIFSEFLFFSFHSSRWMQYAKSKKNIQALDSMFLLESIIRCVFIMNPHFRIIFIHFFYFRNLFYQYFHICKPSNHFSTINQGFSIFERSLEAFYWSISFSLSKSKNTKKNILISIF